MKVKHHAKASSAGSNLDQGNRPGLIRRAFATRGASSGSDGSGAPSGRRSHLLLLVLSVAALAVAGLVTTASATKYFDSSIGTTSATPALGGTFSSVGDIAVNSPVITTDGSGQSGWIYVGDGSRLEAFNAGKEFQFAIGRDVVQTGGVGNVVVNEQHTITVPANVGGGTFTITYEDGVFGPTQTTAAIPVGATAAEVQGALNALSFIGAGGTTVTGPNGGPYAVEFSGGLVGDRDVEQLRVNGAGLAAAIGTELTCQSPTSATTTNFQWLSGGAPATGPGATAATYTTVAADAGKAVQCQVTKINDNAGSTQASDPPVIVAPAPGTAVPGAPSSITISGTASEDQELTCPTTGWSGSPAFAFQWYRSGIAIGGATANKYKLTVTDDDTPAVFQCAVTATNVGGSVTKLSRNKATVTAPSPSAPGGNTSSPSVSTTTLSMTVATTLDGASSFEKCTVASQCKSPRGFGAGTTTSLGNGGWLSVQGVDINQATGDLFVRDGGRISQFSATGAFIRAFGWDVTSSGPGNTGNLETCNAAAGDICKAPTSGSSPGQLGGALTVGGVAIPPPGAPNAGTVYAADPGNSRVIPFTVPAGPTAAVTSGTAFGVPGGSLGNSEPNSFRSGAQPVYVAAGADGIVYGADQSGSTGGQIVRYDSVSQTFLSKIRGAEGAVLGGGKIGGLELDPVSGNLLVGRPPSVGIMELNVSGKPLEVDASLLVDTHFPATTLNSEFISLGANGSSGTYYASNSGTLAGSGTGQRVLVIDDTGIDPPPTVNIVPPSNTSGTAATLNATINPNGPTGFPTSYRFQISKNGKDWADVTANKLVGATGDGGAPVAISDPVTGLEGNTLYRIRVVTTRQPSAGVAISSELVFLTDRVAPDVTTLYPQFVRSDSAVLSGIVRPNALATKYYFEWGRTTAYERGRAPIPFGDVDAGTVSKVVREDVAGLFPDLDFHYRIVAVNSEGTTNGNDMVFHTKTDLAGPAAVRAYEMVTPPFKATRTIVGEGSDLGYVSRASTASASGDAFAWGTFVFPLTDEVRAPGLGDKITSTRTPDGWVSRTNNSLPARPEFHTAFWAQVVPGASGDLKTLIWRTANGGDGELIHSPAPGVYRSYIRRDGTGQDGFTSYLSDPAEDSSSSPVGSDFFPLLNDDGSAVAIAGSFRGLARHVPGAIPGTVEVDPLLGDPSLTQQLPGAAGGQTSYLLRSTDPELINTAHKDLINGCTGTVSGGDATQIPMRNPNGTPGSTADDYLDAQPCIDAEQTAPAATGTGDLAGTAVSNLVTASGAFAAGQIISGTGIPSGTRIVATGPGTLTLSASATTGAAVALSAAPQEVTSVRGAINGVTDPVTGENEAFEWKAASITALANDGDRVVFLSPDGGAQGASTTTCATSVESVTDCAPQVYVRQYEDDGEPIVRWLSRPQGYGSGAPAAGTGTLVAGSNIVTALTTTVGTFSVGATIRGNGLPAGTTVLSTGAGTLTLSANATASGLLTSLSSSSPRINVLAASSFQGASRDGRYVYLRTRTPLLPSDPNNGVDSTVNGTPAGLSNDLYRYELPAAHDDDPAGGTLTRISAGPEPPAVGSGTLTSGSSTVSGVTISSGAFRVGQLISANGIPAGATIAAVGAGTLTLSTNATASGLRAFSAAADPNAKVQTVRYLSDDGQRAYFLTNAPIPGADATPPSGAITTPTGSTNQNTTRNLYAFDGTASGAARYHFIASLPTGTDINRCSTTAPNITGNDFDFSDAKQIRPQASNCFHGTPSGDAVIFGTVAALTAEDANGVFDVYMYDLRSDELVRITTQPAGLDGQEVGYPCDVSPQQGVINRCMGSLMHNNDSPTGGYASGPGWGGGRYLNIAQDSDGVVSVFFETPLRFSEQDTNSSQPTCFESEIGVNCDYWDVYQWRDGKISLVSPGNSDDNSWFNGSSSDGTNVFLFTSARIDPRELDDHDYDYYDARVGGGFPYTPPATPCDVLALECEIDAVPAPQSAGAASAGLHGQGNVQPPKSTGSTSKPRCGKGKVRKAGKCVKRKRAHRTVRHERGSGK